MFRLFRRKPIQIDEMKYLIIGLGNVGADYINTRHNIGFDIVDKLAGSKGASFELGKFAYHTQIKIKGRTVHMIKPTTYMNLSGKAARHWINKEKVKLSNVLVVTDDLNLALGKMRLRSKGSNGGHNGLRSIEELLGTRDYPRLRFGVGDDFSKGRQVEHVLGAWNEDEEIQVDLGTDKAVKAIESFVFRGLGPTMNEFNQ
jgi:PTH1 family peptidyl-tRNA hydrolase